MEKFVTQLISPTALPLDCNSSEKLRNVNAGLVGYGNAPRNSGRITPVLPVPFAFQPVHEKGQDEKQRYLTKRAIWTHESIWAKYQDEREIGGRVKMIWWTCQYRWCVSSRETRINDRVQSSLLLIRGWTNGRQVARGYQPNVTTQSTKLLRKVTSRHSYCILDHCQPIPPAVVNKLRYVLNWAGHYARIHHSHLVN